MTCSRCGGELVEVDNPMRREIRHKRGVDCPGPLTAAEEERQAELLRGVEFVKATSAPLTDYRRAVR